MDDDLNLGKFSSSVVKIYCRKDTRSHIEQDEYSITSSGASLEDSIFRDRDSVEYTRAKCTDTNAESDTCTSPCSLSTDELEIVRKQGAIPKHFRKALPPRPGPPPSEEVSLENCEEDGRKEDSSITKLAETEDDHQKAVEELIFSLKKEKVDFSQDDNQKAVEKLILLLEKETETVDFLHVLDPSKIKLVDGKYSEGSEFIKTGELGKGNIVGPVFKVEDLQTHKEHCLKTVKKSYFKIEELKCMVDLAPTCVAPLLYTFRYRDVAVDLHMEMLTNSFTMEQVIQEKVCELGDLGKPFAYYILREMLMAMSVMQEKKWLHGDIHDKNIMIQLLGSEIPALKFIDFGDAFQIKNAEEDETYLTCEIKMVMSIFTAVFDMICFNDEDDRRESLDHEKKEVLDLVAFAVDTKNPFQSEELFKRVENQFNESLKDLDMTKAEFLRKVVAVLSTEKSDDGAKAREDWEEDIKSPEGNMATLHGEEGDRNTKFPEDGNSSAPLPKPAL